jgi:hypothetical protein
VYSVINTPNVSTVYGDDGAATQPQRSRGAKVTAERSRAAVPLTREKRMLEQSVEVVTARNRELELLVLDLKRELTMAKTSSSFLKHHRRSPSAPRRRRTTSSSSSARRQQDSSLCERTAQFSTSAAASAVQRLGGGVGIGGGAGRTESLEKTLSMLEDLRSAILARQADEQQQQHFSAGGGGSGYVVPMAQEKRRKKKTKPKKNLDEARWQHEGAGYPPTSGLYYPTHAMAAAARSSQQIAGGGGGEFQPVSIPTAIAAGIESRSHVDPTTTTAGGTAADRLASDGGYFRPPGPLSASYGAPAANVGTSGNNSSRNQLDVTDGGSSFETIQRNYWLHSRSMLSQLDQMLSDAIHNKPCTPYGFRTRRLAARMG